MAQILANYLRCVHAGVLRCVHAGVLGCTLQHALLNVNLGGCASAERSARKGDVACLFCVHCVLLRCGAVRVELRSHGCSFLAACVGPKMQHEPLVNGHSLRPGALVTAPLVLVQAQRVRCQLNPPRSVCIWDLAVPYGYCPWRFAMPLASLAYRSRGVWLREGNVAEGQGTASGCRC